jgi:cell wall-associated NlpC family hydrolase
MLAAALRNHGLDARPDRSGVSLRQYIGIPWSDEFTCWGLCCLVLEREFGIALPRYQWIDPADRLAVAQTIERDCGAGQWFPVKQSPKCPDVLLFWIQHPGWPTHAGLALDEARMLHVREGQLSEIAWYDDSWRGRLWRARLCGAWRHRLLAEPVSRAANQTR